MTTIGYDTMHKLLDTFKFSAIIIFIVVICIACDQNNNTEKNSADIKVDTINASLPSFLKIDEAIAVDVADNLWKTSQQYLTATQTAAKDLQAAIKSLLEKPDATTLNLAQKKWQLAMTAYQQLSPLLYLEYKRIEHTQESPDKSSPPTATQKLNNNVDVSKVNNLQTGTLEAKKANINKLIAIDVWRRKIGAWPIQPGYLDSFGPHIHSGIVYDITLSLDAKTLRNQHLTTDSEEVTLGLYAIEYLLFGDKEYKNNTSYKRFLKVDKLPESLAQAGLTIDELPNNRRRTLIELQAQLLLNDIETLIGLYQTSGVFSMTFQQLSALEKLHAFQLSVSNSLQKTLNLFSYYDEDLSSEKENTKNLTDNAKSDAISSDKKNSSVTKNDEKDAFTKRFIINRNLALKNNIATIQSLYLKDNVKQEAASKPAQKTIETSTLSKALLSDENERTVIELLESLKKEVAKKDYKLEEIKSKIKTLLALLAI